MRQLLRYRDLKFVYFEKEVFFQHLLSLPVTDRAILVLF